jgi:hypothetical protein
MNRPRPPRPTTRLPLLAGGGLALVVGLYGGLLLLGFPLPQPGSLAGLVRPALAEVHGPVMVLGFVGTLVALERAAALGARWALAAPAAAGLGALALVVAGPSWPGQVLLATAGALLLVVYGALWGRQPGPALLAQAAGAFAWYAAALLWLAGLPVADLVPWLATFVVATIAGERLELAPLATLGARATPPAPVPAGTATSGAVRDDADRQPGHPVGSPAHRWFLAALAGLFGGATAATLWPATGAHLFGAGVLAVVGWLVTFDVARRMVRARGLPRYVAVGLLTGFAWLAVAGVLWTGPGRAVAGARYDATLHAVFLGFTMSMIFAHAPVVLPAVLRRPLPYRPILYVPLGLLHGALLLRVLVGDGLGVAAVWRWAGAGTVAAVVTFVASAAALSGRSSSRRSGSARADRRDQAADGPGADRMGTPSTVSGATR